MTRTLPTTPRLGRQPGRARVDGASGAAPRSAQVNATGAPFTGTPVVGILAAPIMWTKCATRPLATRST